MKVHEMVEFTFPGPEPEDKVFVDLTMRVAWNGECQTIPGFYAGNGIYKVRYLPQKEGDYAYEVSGSAVAPASGTFHVEASENHGMVHANGIHLQHADGTWFHGFGTTVYALFHQPDDLIDETMETLAAAPFNKIRVCVFPKHYRYNENNPVYYPFERCSGVEEKAFDATEFSPMPEKRAEKDEYWDVHRPCYAFWDRMEKRIMELQDLGLQVDLILFHPYDRWGFSNLHQEDNLVYLEYALRRLSAFPGIWWSLANEYDLCMNKTDEEWQELTCYIAEHDPYRHLLSVHNCFAFWNPAGEEISHMSWQGREMSRVAGFQKRFGKPVAVDECRYEGNTPEFWGNLSGADMTSRFWKVTVQGGHCTHGETFLPGTDPERQATKTGEKDVVWWAKGGRLNGESPERIRFLRNWVEQLPGPIEPLHMEMNELGEMTDEELDAYIRSVPEQFGHFLGSIRRMDPAERSRFFGQEHSYAGHVGEAAYLWYLDDQCSCLLNLELPDHHSYDIHVVDTWNMTDTVTMTDAHGPICVALPSRPYMAVLALEKP